MQEVIDEERKIWGSQASGHSFDNSITMTAKAYQVVHDRIVDEFARKDRETTYVIDETTGKRREETVEDRLAELDFYMEAVSEKNMQRLQAKVNSFRDYKPELSIGSYWEQVLENLW